MYIIHVTREMCGWGIFIQPRHMTGPTHLGVLNSPDSSDKQLLCLQAVALHVEPRWAAMSGAMRAQRSAGPDLVRLLYISAYGG